MRPAGRRRTSLLAPSVLAALSFLALLASLAFGAHVRADDPEQEALRIERRLLCPQCTNLRLDVCDTQICADMRADIHDRLAQGQSEQQIIDSFQARYGQRVLADVPRHGFNLVLFGWVGGSLLLVGVVGTLLLLQMRRSTTPLPAASEADERWLDEQLPGSEHR